MSQQESHRNGSFSSSFGFIMACVGSAVGLGNIWMFPYRLGQYGGGAFLLLYLFFVILFGWVGLSAEIGLGRMAGTGTIGAYALCFAGRGRERLGRAMGWLPLMGSLGIAVGYAVILGWVLRSLAGAATGELLSADPGAFFQQAAVDWGNPFWHAAVAVIVCLLLTFGVTGGIERANKIMMPLFFLLFLALAAWVAVQPGALAGWRFLFVPDWSRLLEADTWVMAIGQAFFSLSITGSGMIVYGAYLSRNEDIPRAALRTAGFDILSALLSALAIVPAAFAYGGQVDQGPALMFVTVPRIFQRMPMGRAFAVFFFLSVAFAGITSLMNMLEACGEALGSTARLSRSLSLALVGAVTFGAGLFVESLAGMGGWMDLITIYVSPFGAMLVAVFLYFVLGPGAVKDELALGGKRPGHIFDFVARAYVLVAVAVWVLGIRYHGIG